MPNHAQPIVAVHPASALDARPRLFAALSEAFPVRFRGWTPNAAEADGLLVVASDPAIAAIPAGRGPVLVVGDATRQGSPRVSVTITAAPPVDRRVRLVTLHDRLLGGELDAGDDVLSASADELVWSRARGARPVDRVRCALTEIPPDRVLYALLSERAIAMVALVHFLRAVSAPVSWRPPGLRAAFVFDDPNLRWRSYGFLDYRRLVAHADEHGYHASMAMIPLDATRPHRATAALFSARADRLSLVVHGNDHVRHELLAPAADDEALALTAQAVRRIERFERRWGVTVERVMMPPHGLCSAATARALGAVGFDALCAIHPVPWTEARPAEPALVAWQPAEFVGGCAVIPRDAIGSTTADLALRGFLDHPIVVYAHHEDVAGGLDLLAEAAARVNRLGDVTWTSVGRIARSNYLHRIEGRRLIVQPFARRLRVEVPKGADTATVAAPAAVGPLALRGWSLDGGHVRSFGDATAIVPGYHDVRLHGTTDLAVGDVAMPAWRPWPKLRRAGTELRDRAIAVAART